MNDFSYIPPSGGSFPRKGPGMNKVALAAVGVAAGLLLIAALVILFLTAGSSKTAPLSVVEKCFNGKYTQTEDFLHAFCGEIGGDEAAKAVRLLRQCDDFNDAQEDYEATVLNLHQWLCEQYGDDVKARIQMVRGSEEKMTRERLNDLREHNKNVGNEYVELSKSLSSLKNSELKELAETLDIRVSDLRKVIGYLKDAGSTLRHSRITEGYTLELEVHITGSELDEPEIITTTIEVLKIDGKWMLGEFELMEDMTNHGLSCLYRYGGFSRCAY